MALVWGTDVVEDTTTAWSGPHSIKFNAVTAASGYFESSLTPFNGDEYLSVCIEIMIKASNSTDGIYLKAVMYESDKATVAFQEDIMAGYKPGSSWKRLRVNYTPSNTTADVRFISFRMWMVDNSGASTPSNDAAVYVNFIDVKIMKPAIMVIQNSNPTLTQYTWATCNLTTGMTGGAASGLTVNPHNLYRTSPVAGGCLVIPYDGYYDVNLYGYLSYAGAATAFNGYAGVTSAASLGTPAAPTATDLMRVGPIPRAQNAAVAATTDRCHFNGHWKHLFFNKDTVLSPWFMSTITNPTVGAVRFSVELSDFAQS